MIIRIPYIETAFGTASFQLSPEQEKEYVEKINERHETDYTSIQEAIAEHDFYFFQHLFDLYCDQYGEYVDYDIEEYEDFELDQFSARCDFENYFRVEEED